MLQHGRKPQSALTIAAEHADAPPPVPPAYFNARERVEWQMLVDCLGAAWFPPECRVLIETYVSASVSLNAANESLSKFDGRLPKDMYERRLLKDLVKLRASLLGQVLALASKLRITPSTRNDRRHTGQHSPRPWEVDALVS